MSIKKYTDRGLQLLVVLGIAGVLLSLIAPPRRQMPRDRFDGKHYLEWIKDYTSGDPVRRRAASTAFLSILRESKSDVCRATILNTIEMSPHGATELTPVIEQLETTGSPTIREVAANTKLAIAESNRRRSPASSHDEVTVQ